jgi:NAD(P)-dependent dehydrogenase (short-subunit alcohol dehydrogenase family)
MPGQGAETELTAGAAGEPVSGTAELFASVRPRYPELRGKVAVVTGSSRGIGRGIAIRLAVEGMRVALHGRDAEALDALAGELKNLGAVALPVAADLRRTAEIDRLFSEAAAAWGTVDLLVNNAADLRRVPFFEVTDEFFDDQVAVNLRGPYLCASRAAVIMRKRGSGCIVNISSVGGLRAHHPGLPYDAMKAGLDGLTRSMGVELARFGIRVNGVAPGAIDNLHRPASASRPRAAREARIPQGRVGHVLEIGAVVAFLASPESSYLVGQTLYADGGITAQLSPPGSQI